MVAQKVLYKLPNDIPLQLSTLRTAITQTLDAKKKKKKTSVNSHINTYLCQFMAQNSEICGVNKKVNFLTSQKLPSFGPANIQSVTYSKIQTKVCRPPYSTPVDRFLIKSVNPEYPVSCCECAQKCHLSSTACGTPLSVSHPPKWYHHIA